MPQRTTDQHREYMRAWRNRGRWLRDALRGIGGPREFDWRSPLHPRDLRRSLRYGVRCDE